MAWITLTVGAIGVLGASCWRDRREGSSDLAVAALAWAPGVGFGVLSLLTFYGLFVGWRWVGSWLFVASALPLGVFLLGRRLRGRGSLSAAGRCLGARRPGRLTALLVLVVIVTLAGLLLGYVDHAKARPHGAADAVNIWVSRSLIAFGAPDDLPNRLKMLRRGHPDYPLMLPAALAGQYALAGSADLAIPRLTGLLFVLGLGGMTFFAVDRLAGRIAGLAAIALVWVTPVVWQWGFGQVADVPLAYLALGAAVGLAAQLEGGGSLRVPPTLAGLFLGLLPWTKNEGAVVALALTVAFAVALWRGRPRDPQAWKRLPWIALGAMPGLTATVLFKSFWVNDKEIGRFFGSSLEHLTDLGRWQALLTALGSNLGPGPVFDRWGLVWVLLFLGAVVTVVRRRRERPSWIRRFLGLAIVLSLSAYLLAYALSPYEVSWHVGKSVHRLLLQVFPLALVAVFLGLGPLMAPPGETGSGPGS